MFYSLIFGIVLSGLLFIVYFILNKKNTTKTDKLPWHRCFLVSIQIYLLTILLGSLSTVLFQNLNNALNLSDFLENVVYHFFGLFVYAMIFTVFLVLPVLIFGLKYLSKSNLTTPKKELAVVLISSLLVLLINLMMSNFFSNPDFLLFLLGYSFFGAVTPWFYVKRKKVFG